MTLENIEKYGRKRLIQKIRKKYVNENNFISFRIVGPILNGFIKLVVPFIKIALSIILFSASVAIIFIIVLLALNQFELLDQVSH